jgi:hypothetical protein
MCRVALWVRFSTAADLVTHLEKAQMRHTLDGSLVQIDDIKTLLY